MEGIEIAEEAGETADARTGGTRSPDAGGTEGGQRWGDLGGKCSKTWLFRGSKCYLSIGKVLPHRSRVDQPTCPNRHKHCAALEIFLMRKPAIQSKKAEVAFPPQEQLQQ